MEDMDACMVLLLVLSKYLPSASAGVASGWNYKTEDAFGPLGWSLSFPESCNGTRNSPIDIVQAVVRDKPLWNFSEAWNTNGSFRLENKGSTVEFTPLGNLTASGGDLPAIYNLQQFHFHWSNSSEGSEHRINGTQFALELHAVHVKSHFRNITEALASNQPDALAALGFLFQISDQSNPDLESLLNATVGVVKEMSKVDEVSLPPLGAMLSGALAGDFFRYNGSITVPLCSEEVVWTIFKTPTNISLSQLAMLQALNTSTFGVNLFRPPQPIGSRAIYMYTTYTATMQAFGAQESTQGPNLQGDAQGSTVQGDAQGSSVQGDAQGSSVQGDAQGSSVQESTQAVSMSATTQSSLSTASVQGSTVKGSALGQSSSPAHFLSPSLLILCSVFLYNY